MSNQGMIIQATVSLSADGRTVAIGIGSHVNDDNGVYSGHVRVFNQDAS